MSEPDRGDSVAGLYPAFRLPDWFDAPDDVRQRLHDLWAGGRPRTHAAARQNGARYVRGIYGQLVGMLWGQGDAIGYRRCGYLGWALALGCLEVIERVAPEDAMPRAVFAGVYDWLADPAMLTERDWEPLFPAVFEGSHDLEYDEARLAFWALTCLLAAPRDAVARLVDMIDSCISGDAMDPHGSGREDLWRWLLVAAFPAAWSLRLPDRIWRRPTAQVMFHLTDPMAASTRSPAP